MRPTITLTIVNGPLEGLEYVFQEPCKHVIGRADDCTIQLPKIVMHSAVSRHHCLLVIDPPEVSVQDLGSINGTYVNGEELGHKLGNEILKRDSSRTPPRLSLKSGDELKVGDVVFKVSIACGDESLTSVFLPLAIG